MRLENLSLIGNCQAAAHVSTTGDVVWCCLPRFDSEPVFASLLDADGGRFHVGPEGGGSGVQRYVENTNVVETLFDTDSGTVCVTDFFPRFQLHGRSFRPTQLFRMIEPIDGTPRVRIVCDPRRGWSKRVPERVPGSNHVSYAGFPAELRLTTDVPLSYLDGRPFTLSKKRYLVLSWGAPIEEPLAPLAERFLAETLSYWQTWVKHCNVPPLYQREVIRSALALKLHCFEDTGAIVAATTTSIPEMPGSGRNWDYRYCWLRDAAYSLAAFRALGHFEEREKFVHFLLDIAGGAEDLNLAPLYRVDGTSELDEHEVAGFAGLDGAGHVRIGNRAALHRQNDVYGEMVLSLAPIFLDERFAADRTPATLALLERLARKAVSTVGQPDAGIWEYRTEWVPQTFSTLMSWAAADRAARVTMRHARARTPALRAHAETVREILLRDAWSETRHAFTGSHGGTELDASLLQMAPLGFLPKDDPRLLETVRTLQDRLGTNGWLKRYDVDDGFGVPAVAFVICTYWLVEALATIGKRDEAQTVFRHTLEALSPTGLLAEDWDPRERVLRGNYPQAYSHVGLIHAAFAASPAWNEVI